MDCAILLAVDNAFAYFAYFKREAKKAGWSSERITAVLDDAMSSNYEHALAVILDALSELQEEQEPIAF